MLALDEEVDYVEYQQYLRRQSDSDLCDILTHLDPINCPRRSEAVNREIGRRRIDLGITYRESENIWRKFLMLATAIAALTLLLGAIMSSDEAVAPQPPPSLDLYMTGNFVQFSSAPEDGGSQLTAVIIEVYAAQLAENYLRDSVLLASRSGLYLIILASTLWKLASCLRQNSDDPLSVDVRRLATIAVVLQLLVMLFAPVDNLPELVNNGHQVAGGFLARSVTVVAPWG